jgi:putative DNA primase/helicase
MPDDSTVAQLSKSQKSSLHLVEASIEESFSVVDMLEKSGFPIQIPNLLPFDRHDAGNAERLLAVFRPYIRYCEDYKKWLIYDGRRWQMSATNQVRKATKYVMARFLMQAINSDNQDLQLYARRSLDSRAVRDTMESAACEVALAPGRKYDSTRLDEDPYLLNCLNGTLDLSFKDKRFVLRRHDPADFITRLVHYDYNPESKCELFTRFVERIMGGGPKSTDAERSKAARMIPYLQRAFGSVLTGDVADKAVFVFFGQGDNGKTTLLEAVRHVLKEYSAQVLVDTLVTHSKNPESNATRSDLSDLQGARFVTTSETEEGQRLAEAKVKYLTSMGYIKTCRKYENFVEFPPTHKLFIDGNYRPVVRGSDAIWDRLRLVPFTIRIPKSEIDRQLGNKLKREAEGILSWLVKGCEDWHWYRITNPTEVSEAGQEWREQDDPVSGFISEYCEVQPERLEVYTKTSDLWRAYQSWAAREADKHPLNRTAFSERLERFGCQKDLQRLETGVPTRIWRGIMLRNAGSGMAVDNEPE